GVPLGVRAQAPPPLAPPPPPPPPPDFPAPDGGSVQVAPTTPDTPNPPTPETPTPNPPAPNPPTPTTAGVTLRYKFTPGRVLRYRLTTDTNGTIQMGPSGTGMPLKQHMTMTLTQTVKDVRASDGAATVVAQLGSVSMTVNGRPIMLPAQDQEQINKPMTAVVTPTGQVLSVQTPSGTLSGPAALGFNPMDLQKIGALPEKPVNTGDTWPGKYEAPGGVLNIYTKSTLSSLAGTAPNTIATIAQKLYLQFQPKAFYGKTATGKTMASRTATGAAPVAKINGLITGTGTQKFDVDAGVINSQTNALQLKMTITPPKTAQAGAPPPVKANFQITSDMERVTDSGTIAPAAPNAGGAGTAPAAPTNEPPTGQLQ
ncbi:MAG: hypothetical protein JO250_08135, partial [Armatimonadetes bacterium]|nr:hypothetical protein [Armatimonadota bacterium]